MKLMFQARVRKSAPSWGLAFPEIEKSGAVVISDTPTYSKGTIIKPYKVIIERKKNE